MPLGIAPTSSTRVIEPIPSVSRVGTASATIAENDLRRVRESATMIASAPSPVRRDAASIRPG